MTGEETETLKKVATDLARMAKLTEGVVESLNKSFSAMDQRITAIEKRLTKLEGKSAKKRAPK